MSVKQQISDSKLSGALKKLLEKAGFEKFSQLAALGIRDLTDQVPKLNVRHMVSIKCELIDRGLRFKPGEAIETDVFINQTKLTLLWEKKVRTYKELDQLPVTEFIKAMGGPHSLFFRDRKNATRWMEAHDIGAINKFNNQGLTKETFKAIFNKGFYSLEDLNNLSDYEIAQVFQPGFRSNGRLNPLTRARLMEVKYYLSKHGISRSFKPL